MNTDKLSDMQLAALLDGLHGKLSRSSLGWSLPPEPGEPAIINDNEVVQSLYEAGFFITNFDDPLGFSDEMEDWIDLEILDGATHPCGTPRFDVWTSIAGRRVLLEHYGPLEVTPTVKPVVEPSNGTLRPSGGIVGAGWSGKRV